MNSLSTILDDVYEFIKNCIPTGAEQYLMAIGAAIGLFISIAVGGMDKMIYALIALMILDYTTGMIAAFKTGQWDSSTGFVGLAKKAVILAVVALCNTVDMAMDTHALRQMAICAYALNEAGSIVENIDRAGWGEHIPAFIRNALARLQSKQEGTKDESKKI
jgi:toxin secretion/phage lysis holin|nr:MAG TPA: holin [Caudoviricetes sp.]